MKALGGQEAKWYFVLSGVECFQAGGMNPGNRRRQQRGDFSGALAR